ncbi:hypothetical protein BVC80_1667g24 [Macleaya cordata]|nr:hypothetical protein BVC80_1667g24 [Macleaya cordata]
MDMGMKYKDIKFGLYKAINRLVPNEVEHDQVKLELRNYVNATGEGDDLTWAQVREVREPIDEGPRTRSRNQQSDTLPRYNLIDEPEGDDTQEPLDTNMEDIIREDDLVDKGGEDGIVREDDERDDYL